MADGTRAKRKTRYRLSWWLVGETIPRQAQWYSSDCKLCAGKRALSLGDAYAKVRLAPVDAVRWEVSRMDLHGGESRIIATSGRYGRELVKRHAHRESGTGTVRSTVDFGRIVGAAGSPGFPGGRWKSGKLDVVSAPGRDGTDGQQS